MKFLQSNILELVNQIIYRVVIWAKEIIISSASLLKIGNENLISLSLYLLDMGVTDAAVKDKLIRKTVEIIASSDDSMKLSAKPFSKGIL